MSKTTQEIIDDLDPETAGRLAMFAFATGLEPLLTLDEIVEHIRAAASATATLSRTLDANEDASTVRITREHGDAILDFTNRVLAVTTPNQLYPESDILGVITEEFQSAAVPVVEDAFANAVSVAQ